MTDDLPIKPAATVMLVRDTPAGPEVFMLRRTSAAVFAGGMYVYPGGKVDEADGHGDRAFVLAAIRECYEEAGVLLAVDAHGDMVRDGHPALAHRDAVYEGRVDVRALAEGHGLRLAFDRLVWVAHWVTPRGEPRRFDTRLYVTPCPEGQTSHHDDNETVASMWVRPVEALARWTAGELGLMPPTIATLQFLAEHSSVTSIIEAARTIGTPPRILPRLRIVDGRLRGLALPGDADYDSLPE